MAESGPNSHSPCVHLQMVHLYQDPEGKTIFSHTDPSQSNVSPASDQDIIDSLRRRIQELENEVSNFAP